VFLWCIFLLRKWLKILMKVVVNTSGVVESYWSPQLGDYWPTNFIGSLGGSGKARDSMCSEGGSHFLGCACCGEESWWIGTIVGVEPRFWDVDGGEWIAKRDRSPYGLIALALGLIFVEIK
jgi:hypothetical protein